MSDDPFMHMLAVARKNGASSAKYIDGILDQRTESFISKDAEMMRNKILGETGSKFQMYCRINPELEKHEIYCDKYVAEHHRIAFTRFRTSCHRLRIETGRWSRLEREERVCTCEAGGIQDEAHAIETCTHLSELRLEFTNDLTFTLEEISKSNYAAAAAFIFKALEILE